MQKKLMAVAVAGAFAAPAVALAQNPSTVQIFGTLYWEYAWAHQGSAGNGNAAPTTGNPLAGGTYTGGLPNVDLQQTPGSEIGFKGEENLGGSLSAWFQCLSTFDVRGSSPQGFCGRNSAIGFKGSWGNIFAGVWDTPFKRTIDLGRVGGADTGIFGTAFLLTSNSTTTDGRAAPTAWKRRQANSFTYESPNFSGFQVLAMASTLSTNNTVASGVTSAIPGNKPRVYSLGASYVNGPLQVGAAYELHQNFYLAPNAAGGAAAAVPATNSDYAYHLSGAYTFFGALKVGATFTHQSMDVASSAATGAFPSVAPGGMSVNAYMLGADWKITGPHGLRGNWTHANSTSGSFGNIVGAGAGPLFPAGSCAPTLVGNRVANCGTGSTGADLYQIQYYYTFSKRTEASVGYVYLDNAKYARYSLGGLTTPQGGAQQNAVAVTVRHTF